LEGVTTILSKQGDSFDAQAVATKCAMAKTGKYAGKTVSEILEMWELNRDWAAVLGERMHHRIQDYYDLGVADWFSMQTLYDGESYHGLREEFNKFLFFEKYRQHKGWFPYRMEWIIFDESPDRLMGGTVDAVFKSKEGFHIVDWKRTKKFDMDRAGKQLRLYAEILKSKYSLNVLTWTVVCIHPNSPQAQIAEGEP
jgi:ATP-dependent exoDNAse (exonuclease V) beta subunit